jgi:hypothetical protein
MEFVIAIYILVAGVGIYQLNRGPRYLPPLTPEQIEWRKTMDYHIENSSSEDSGW